MKGEEKLNFKEFSTVFVQVESCLNSCLITPITKASDELEVLTPDHFLIARRIKALPDESDHLVMNPLKRW